MRGSVEVIAGPAGSGKTDWLLARYRHQLSSGVIGSALWISPTHRSAGEVRARLLQGELTGCFSPAVMTFAQFAEKVLAASSLVVQPISDLVKRQIVRRLLLDAASAGRLRHFGPISHTAGLVDLAAEFIGELKRHEIWPDEFEQACRQRGAQRKDRELLDLYRRYQDHLNKQQLYDAEGRFWTARELLRAGEWGPCEHVRHVVVDGFTDFTRTQHEILDLLGQRVETLQVSLPLEGETDRPDLFAKPASTLARLQNARSAISIQSLQRAEPPGWPALAHIERQLFRNPRLVRAAPHADRVEIIEAGRIIDEMYLVGRRIKRLLVEGDPVDGRRVGPAEAAVVVRNVAAVATLIREAFDDLGLPYLIDEGYPLAQVPITAALVALLRLQIENWPFRGVLHVFGNNYFRPAWPEWGDGSAASQVDRAVRGLQIAGGLAPLNAGLRRQAEAAVDPADPAAQQLRDDARVTLALVERLAHAWDRMPRQATPGEWARALAALAGTTGLTRDLKRSEPDALAKLDQEAWELLLEALQAAERFTSGEQGAAEILDIQQLYELLTDVIQTQRLRPLHDEVGRVRVLSATSARALSIPYLFFAGLSERSFPSPARADRLYSEGEYEQLAEAGLPLVLRAEASQEEMLLFYEIVTRAKRRLYLSYPGLDEKGQPLLPSPYLLELEQICGERVERFKIEDLRPLPSDGAAASAVDERVLGVAQLVGLVDGEEAATAATTPRQSVPRPRQRRNVGSTSHLAGMAVRAATRSVFDNILAGLSANASRSSRDEFGPFEGMLDSDTARVRLQARFDSEVRWSASRLELYGSCPYKFFLSQVLRLKTVDELSLSTDPLSRGSALHDVLARAHRAMNAAHDGPVSPASKQVAAHFRQAVDHELAALQRRAEDRPQPYQAALAEIERRVLAQWLERYPAQHAEYDSLWGTFDDPPVPAHFEVSFGETSAGDDPLSTVEPLVLTDGTRTVRVRGRIDRVDLGRVEGRPVFNVLDYKTGSSQRYSLKAIDAGEALQVFLYALAAEQLFAREGRVPWAAAYWFVADQGYSAKQSLQMFASAAGELQPTAQWQALRDKDIERVLTMVDNLRAGRFPVASRDEHCTSYCAFSTICRINQVRSTEKEWDPQARQD